MWISFNVYKKSALATIMSLVGTVLWAYGLGYFVYGISDGQFEIVPVVLFVIGLALVITAGIVNKRVVRRKREKALSDPAMLATIRNSVSAAYALYKNEPSPGMLEYIRPHNPQAVMMIECYLRGEFSEDVLIEELRAFDAARNVGNVVYNNTEFSIGNIQTQSEVVQSELKKAVSAVKALRVATIITAVIMVVSLVGVIYFSGVKIEEEYAAYEDGLEEYTHVSAELVKLEPLGDKNEYADYYSYYRYTDSDGKQGYINGYDLPVKLNYLIVTDESQAEQRDATTVYGVITYDEVAVEDDGESKKCAVISLLELQPKTETSPLVMVCIPVMSISMLTTIVLAVCWGQNAKKRKVLQNMV